MVFGALIEVGGEKVKQSIARGNLLAGSLLQPIGDIQDRECARLAP